MNGYTCAKCGTWVSWMFGHSCWAYIPYLVLKPQPYTYALTPLPSKCNLCGSTATDHTEKQCLKDRKEPPINT